MVCSSAMSSNFVWLQIIFCSCVNETTRDRSRVKKADRFASRRYSLKNKLGDRMIKQLLNSVIAKYRDLPVSRTSIICLSLRPRQIIDLLATDKSRYFAQPHPIIVNYLPSAVFTALMLEGPNKWLKQINQIKLNRVKNLKWPEANQLAIYKRDRRFELGTTVNKSS